MIAVGFASLLLTQAKFADVHLKGTRMEVAMEKFSSIFSEPWASSPVFKDCIVLVDADHVTAEEIRNRLASTFNGTWEHRKDGWHLTKTTKNLKSDEEKIAGLRLKFLRKTLDIRAKSLSGKSEFTNQLAVQTYQQLKSEEAKDSQASMVRPGPSPAGYDAPGQRFMSRFLAKFGFDRIAAIPNGHREVFAMRPNQMQKKLDVDISDEFKKYQSEFATWLKATEQLTKAPEGRPNVATGNTGPIHIRSGGSDDFGFQAAFNMLNPDPQDFLFSVYCSPEGTYEMTLLGVPKTGSPDYGGSLRCSTFEGAFDGMEASDFEIQPRPEFKLSEEAQDFYRLFSSRREPLDAATKARLVEKFADPTKTEPLSYGLSEAIIFDARRLKKKIIASLSDNNLNVFEAIYGDAYFNDKYSELSADFLKKDGDWLEMTRFPGEDPNLPRQELKSIIANVRKSKRVTMWDRARLAGILPRTNRYSYMLGFIEAMVDTPREEYGDNDALKILGLLNQSEMDRAFRPEGIRYGDLNSKLQQHLFECCYYNQHNRLAATEKASNISAVARFEATFMAPDGILNDSIFRIVQNAEDQIKDSDETGRFNLMESAKDWGRTIYQLDHPEEFPGSNFTFDRKRVLHRVRVTQYKISLQPSSFARWEGTLQTVDIVGGTGFTISSLPDDMKADFDAGYKEAAESAAARRKVRGGGGGSQPFSK